MPRSTFTVLVTVEYSDGAGHSPSRISEAIQTALEEGTSETAPFLSAQVDAFKGALIDDQKLRDGDCQRLRKILPLHTYLR